MEWPLLAGVPGDDVRRVIAAARRRTFAKGEVVFHDQDPADSLHLIAKGRVAVRITTPLGHTATLSVIGPGSVFGEMALLGEPVRMATAVALEPAETFSIDRATFDRLREEHPSVRDVLERILVERLRSVSARLVEALYVPADVRVRRRLLELAESYGDRDGELTIPLNQEDLASLAGTTRATVNRVLRDEKARGAVRLGRGRVVVADPDDLARRAR